MQLYAKCIQLESQKEMFRLFKALGQYINNSGLDQAFTEPEIYGPATIDQMVSTWKNFLKQILH